MGSLVLLERILPLYLVVVGGWIAARFAGVRKESIAPLAVYLLVPVVVFSAVARANFGLQQIVLAPLFFLISSAMSVFGYKAAGLFFPSPAKNILGFSSGQANSGYFAIPVGIAFFGHEHLATIVLCTLGFVVAENTVGVFIVARGHYSARDSLLKVLQLPAIYGLILGLVSNFSGLRWEGMFGPPVGPVEEFLVNIRATYSVLGMMLIGLAIADLKSLQIDYKFVFFALFTKYLVWPIVVLSVLKLDAATLGVFDASTARIVFFMSTVPIAANSVAYSTLLKAEPEKTAIAVLISTLLALVSVPLMNSWFY